MTTLHAVSLFAGIGGFELGLAAAGVPALASVEIDPAARGVIADRLPGTAPFNDVREVSSVDLLRTGFEPERGILTAGFPCQDLSVAGRRAGLAGPRSGLFFEIVRLAANLRPRWLILENVPGLLGSHGGRDMGAILGSLAGLGYSLAWRVLDAQFFGVPQRRRRVIIVGHLGDGNSAEQVLLDHEGSGGHLASGRASGQVVAALTANGPGAGTGADDNTAQAGHLIPATVSTLQSLDGRRGYRIDAEAAAGGHLIPAATSPIGVRRLTPIECEALQGFPRDWTATSNGKEQADSPRYRQLGNAVAVPVIAWVARRLVATDSATA